MTTDTRLMGLIDALLATGLTDGQKAIVGLIRDAVPRPFLFPHTKGSPWPSRIS